MARESEKRHHHHKERSSDHKEHKNRKSGRDERYDRYVWDEKEKEREKEKEKEKSRERSSRSKFDRSEKHRDADGKSRESEDRKDSKRKREFQEHDTVEEAGDKVKRSRNTVAANVEVPSPAVATPDQAVRQVSPVPELVSAAPQLSAAASAIEKSKRLLELRKNIAEKLKNIPALKNETPAPEVHVTAPLGPSDFIANPANLAAMKRAQECVIRMGFEQPPGSLSLQVPGATAPAAPKTVKAPVLRLDAQGREIDENGVVVDRRKSNISTLKVNINKQKKEAFQILHPELEEDPINNPHFDSELGIDRTKLVRAKRVTFQFVEQGRLSKKAEIMRLNSRYGAAKAREIRAKQAALAKAKAEGDINPNLIEVSERIFKDDKHKDPIPGIEWWDYVLLPPQTQSYDDVIDGMEVKYKKEKINIYVEHPVPIEPPAEPAPPPPQPLKLTKKEQKKMRTQRRLAREKERQELVRQGKIEPPKAKVKMSNLFNVLGAQATQDPTRLEQEIRTAAAERERAHLDRNLARKLTPAERREKKEKRLFDDPGTLETIVAVFRVNDLSHTQTRFKVDINAQQNKLTGCAVITDNMTVVVVEGGVKSIKRYTKLMLRRINWAAKEEEDGEEGDGGEEAKENKCVQVWQGSVARAAFAGFFIQKFHTAGAARKYLADAGVGHYWDTALNHQEE